MNEVGVTQLLEKLSKDYNVPMPIFFFINRKREKIKYGSKLDLSCYYWTFPKLVDKEDLGLIFISKTKRGIQKESVIHEFLHYYGLICSIATKQTEIDEKKVRSLTYKWLKQK